MSDALALALADANADRDAHALPDARSAHRPERWLYACGARM
jgi:hypothetical protein